MLSFPKEFYEAETRNDFLVDVTMKTVWAAELEVLAHIAAVCEKYQLPWFAYSGTLLGAVRHQGFVPWDDDIDICMLRGDYQKLLAVLPGELPEEWHVYNAMCGEDQTQFWTCVMNSDSVSIEEERLAEFHGCPFICGVDIFPLDYIPNNQKEARMERSLFDLVQKGVQLAQIKEPTKKNKRALKDVLKALEDFCHIKFNQTENMVAQLWRVGNQICASYGEADGDYVTNYSAYVNNPDFFYDKHWFDDMEYFPFESVSMPVPVSFENVLEMQFGDWKTPIRGESTHGYPFYNEQLRQLQEMIKEMEEN